MSGAIPATRAPRDKQDDSASQKTLGNAIKAIRNGLDGRSIVFVGIMGVGKSTIGKRVARLLSLPFVDADAEIERAANLSVAEIFDKFGEPYFRAGERRVIARLLKEESQILSTGGGAFVDADTRRAISKSAISIWLDAEIDLIMQRVSRRKTRPLLKQADPRAVIENLLVERNPLYSKADHHFMSRDISRDAIAEEIIIMLGDRMAAR